jgi:N-methylhydantoinase A
MTPALRRGMREGRGENNSKPFNSRRPKRNRATVIFVTTGGFEDVPIVQRINRKNHISLNWTKPKSLVKRRNCFGVNERLNFHGQVLAPLDGETLKDLAARVARS